MVVSTYVVSNVANTTIEILLELRAHPGPQYANTLGFRFGS